MNLATIEQWIGEIDPPASPQSAIEASSFDELLAALTPGNAPLVSPVTVLPQAEITGIAQRAGAEGVDPALVLAIVENESGFNPSATSPLGAMGLMQLMPETARDLGVTNAYDAGQNVAAGTEYLRLLLDRFGGNIPLAVAAYNAGPEAVERYGGIPPYAETQRYVGAVLQSYARWRS